MTTPTDPKDKDGCRRCGERGIVTGHGPLMGLCLVCIENDYLGMTAAVEVARREGARAEREACAQVAFLHERSLDGAQSEASGFARTMARDIAAAIRARED